MNHFADSGKTNPIQSQFKANQSQSNPIQTQNKPKTNPIFTKNLEKLAHLVRKLAHLIRRFAEFPPDFPGYFVWTLPALPLFVQQKSSFIPSKRAFLSGFAFRSRLWSLFSFSLFVCFTAFTAGHKTHNCQNHSHQCQATQYR